MILYIPEIFHSWSAFIVTQDITNSNHHGGFHRYRLRLTKNMFYEQKTELLTQCIIQNKTQGKTSFTEPTFGCLFMHHLYFFSSSFPVGLANKYCQWYTIFYFHSDAVCFGVNIKNYVIELILATIFHGSMFFTVFMTCIVQEGGGTHK